MVLVNPFFQKINLIPSSAPRVDLKPLPEHLRYEFLGSYNTYPVIVSSRLTPMEIDRLLEILRRYRAVIGYSIDDMKGIRPTVCMHRIFLEDDVKPTREHQRRLNPHLQEVVKKEVLKLLGANIIYPISDSQ